MIELTDRIVDEGIIEKAVAVYRERGIILPTFAEQRDPRLVPDVIKKRLSKIGLWDLDPLNLFRITWKNQPIETGGGYGGVNYLEIPSELTGVSARIVTLLGKWFPTGAHKVGAAYGCLAPRIVTGQFDPTYHKAVWPSTGNYCRGGAFDSYLMGCTAVAILPEGMSRERFDWLNDIGAEVIATAGTESNVKEIYDKCWEIRETVPEALILNQFDEFGNAVWHYHVTGAAVDEVYKELAGDRDRFAGWVSSTGSAGTIAAGDYLRTRYPRMAVVAAEALQCPTLLAGGFGAHQIEGIGDKHVPWIHNVRNTDLVTAVDDEDCMRLLRLFNEPAGVAFLRRGGVDCADQLGILGISSISNILSAIKTARYLELTDRDFLLTVATDSADMYRSRLAELEASKGAYDEGQAALDHERCLMGQRTDNLQELTYRDRRRIHNLKYFTWVEQQAKSVEDLEQLWYDTDLWERIFSLPDTWDPLIKQFNDRTGLLGKLEHES